MPYEATSVDNGSVIWKTPTRALMIFPTLPLELSATFIALIFASFQIGGVIGRAATKLVNRYTYLGYIKLNKADEILIRDTIERNDKSLIKLIANFSAQLIIGLLTSLASFYLTYK